MAKTQNTATALAALLSKLSPADQSALLALAQGSAPVVTEAPAPVVEQRSIGLTEARLILSEADQNLAAAKQSKAPASRIQELQRIKLEASERMDALLSANKQRSAASRSKGTTETVSAPAPEAPANGKRSRKSSAPVVDTTPAANGIPAFLAREDNHTPEAVVARVNARVDAAKRKQEQRRAQEQETKRSAPVAELSAALTVADLESQIAALEETIAKAQASIATAKGKTERSRSMETWSALLEEQEALSAKLEAAREEEKRQAAASRPTLATMEKRSKELEASIVSAQARVLQAKGKEARVNAMAEVNALLEEQEELAAAMEEAKREEAARHHEQSVTARPKARQGNGAVILPPNATSEQGERVLSEVARQALASGAVVTKVARGVLKRTTDIDAVVSAIAARCFKLRTLAPRGKDNLDYAEVHVSDVREALVAAFQAGQEAQRLLSAPVVEQEEQEEQDNTPAPRSAAKTSSAGNSSVKRSAPAKSGHTKVAIIGSMLLRKEGATAAELCHAAQMEKMSVPAQAQAAGVVIYKTLKEDNGSGRQVMRYFGKPAA